MKTNDTKRLAVTTGRFTINGKPTHFLSLSMILGGMEITANGGDNSLL
jgi:hypothetical protein